MSVPRPPEFTLGNKQEASKSLDVDSSKPMLERQNAFKQPDSTPPKEEGSILNKLFNPSKWFSAPAPTAGGSKKRNQKSNRKSKSNRKRSRRNKLNKKR